VVAVVAAMEGDVLTTLFEIKTKSGSELKSLCVISSYRHPPLGRLDNELKGCNNSGQQSHLVVPSDCLQLKIKIPLYLITKFD
jgi:hypothetical protein